VNRARAKTKDTPTRVDMSPVDQINTGGTTLPASSISREPTQAPSDQTSHGGVHPKTQDNMEPPWNGSCDTTVRGLDSDNLDVVSRKRRRLFSPPNEIDEVELNDVPELPPTPSPLPQEESQYNDTQFGRHRRVLGETVRKLQDGCNKMLDIRLKVHERRSIIRRERQDLSDKDAQLMQELRNVLLTSPNEKLKPLLDLCEEMQTLRNELLPKEDDYNILEDQLISAEFELEETGGKLLTVLEGVRNSWQGENDLGSLLEDPAELTPAPSVESETRRPEDTEYLSRLGDRDIVFERLSELRHERAMLVEEEKVRARVGMVLGKEAQEFLDTFDSRHDQLQQELAIIENDIARLIKTQERTEGIFFATTLFDNLDDGVGSAPDEVRHSDLDLPPAPMLSSDIVQPTATQDQPTPVSENSDSSCRDPLLLSVDDTEPTFNRFPGSDSRSLTIEHRINAWLLKQQGSMGADVFINAWLLNVLRSSVSEIYQYKSALDEQTLNISREGLRDLVLEWWSLDDAAGEYLKTLRLEARGLSLSATSAISTRKARSDMFVFTLNRLSDRLHKDCTVRRVSETVRLTIRRPRSI
jgi:hypothetical protein